MTIIAGCVIEIETEDGLLWYAQNGAKRTRLSLYAAQGVHIERVDSELYLARDAVPVWTGEAWGREASLYLYPAEKDELHAVWLNSHCGFGVTPKDAVLWQASSVGGSQKQRESNRGSQTRLLHREIFLQARRSVQLVRNHTRRRSASSRYEVEHYRARAARRQRR